LTSADARRSAVADDTEKRLDDVRRYSNCDCNEDERSAIMDVRHNEGECQIGFLLSLIDSLLAELAAAKEQHERQWNAILDQRDSLRAERDHLRAEVARKDEALLGLYEAMGADPLDYTGDTHDAMMAARAALGEKP
jgi:hypothetical protein